MHKVVYFFCDQESDPVASYVLNAAESAFAIQDADFTFCGKTVRYCCYGGVEFYFARTPETLSHMFDRALPELEEKFSDDRFDFAGVVNWHAGVSAPPRVFCAHGIGSPINAAFAQSNGNAIKSILNAASRIKGEYVDLGDWIVAQEATHFSGTTYGQDAANLMRWGVPQADFEIGSNSESYSNKNAALTLARALVEGICDANDASTSNALWVGGIHFEPNVVDALSSQWAFPHVLTYPWIGYDASEEESYQRLKAAVAAFDQAPRAVVFHQKCKGELKNAARRIALELGCEVKNHKAFRNVLS